MIERFSIKDNRTFIATHQIINRKQGRPTSDDWMVKFRNKSLKDSKGEKRS